MTEGDGDDDDDDDDDNDGGDDSDLLVYICRWLFILFVSAGQKLLLLVWCSMCAVVLCIVYFINLMFVIALYYLLNFLSLKECCARVLLELGEFIGWSQA